MPMPPGPHKLTDIVRQKLDEAAAIDATIEEMAFYADVSKQSLYTWFKSEPELKERLDALRQKPFLKARQTLVKDLENPAGAQWYMERKAKKEFGKNMDITSDGKQLPVPILNVLSTDNGDKKDSGTE
jgi:hypothetical protein